jgi:hypothetical protein
MTPRAVSGEPAVAFLIENGLGHDRSCRVAGAEKQHVIVVGGHR